ncbi:MAG: hypothetical protein ACJAQ4_002196 [Cryomorphaceae bacterium]|jgi:hypothetical protein
MNLYLISAYKEFQRYETLGRKTMEQLSDDDLLHQPAQEVNPIAVIVKQLHGNMMSRWTDFMSEDGEKEWRERDGEFEDTLKNARRFMSCGRRVGIWFSTLWRNYEGKSLRIRCS